MGNILFGVDIAGIVFGAMDGQLLDVTIEREVISGTRDPDNPAGGYPTTPATFGAQGFWEDFDGTEPGVTVELGDRKACIIGDSIEAGGRPLKNDKITIEGVSLYMTALLSRDPAAALYVYHCKQRKGPTGK